MFYDVLTTAILAADGASGAGSKMSVFTIVLYLVFLFGLMYFMIIRPQKKQQKQMQDVHEQMEPGDRIMTTGGFYGEIVSILDDNTVIVEFGNNRNCRIPMHKNAIAEVEKAGAGVAKEEVEEEAPEETKASKKKKEKK